MSVRLLNLRGFVFLLIIVFFVQACQPTAIDENDPVHAPQIDISSSAETHDPAHPGEEAATPVFPTIAVDFNTLRGSNIIVAHPFAEEETLFEQFVREFNLNNSWGIHVEARAYSGIAALSRQLTAAGDEPGLVIGLGADLGALETSVKWLDLRAFANDPQYGIARLYDGESVFAQFSPAADRSSWLPTLPLAYDAGVLFYNSGWAKELGYSQTPSNLADIWEIGGAAKTNNAGDDDHLNNGTGGLALSQSALSALSWYVSFGGEMGDPEEGFLPSEEALISSFQALKSAYLADESWIGVDPTSYRYFSDRLAVYAEGSLAELTYFSAYQTAGDFQDEWTALPYLDPHGGAHLVLQPLSFAIPEADEKNELAAWFFGRWLLESEQQDRLTEIHGLWPAVGDPAKIAPDYAKANPGWAAALQLSPALELVPALPAWQQTQLVFQDAYQRVYNLDAQYFPSILTVFKETLERNLEQQDGSK